VAKIHTIRAGKKVIKIREVTPKTMFDLAKKGVQISGMMDYESGGIKPEVLEAVLDYCIVAKDEKEKQEIKELILDDWQLFFQCIDKLFAGLKIPKRIEEAIEKFRG